MNNAINLSVVLWGISTVIIVVFDVPVLLSRLATQTNPRTLAPPCPTFQRSATPPHGPIPPSKTSNPPTDISTGATEV